MGLRLYFLPPSPQPLSPTPNTQMSDCFIPGEDHLEWVVAFLEMEVHSKQLYPAVMRLLAVVGGRVVGWGWGLGT